MKATCDFCKTEYNLPNKTGGAVKCAVCGHTWYIRRTNQRSVWLTFIAALCALLAAIVFTVVVITHHNATQPAMQPLVALVDGVHTTMDENNVAHYVVDGTVVNQSDDMYGVPDLIVLSYDENGRVIGRQKFMSPATLLDAGGRVSFSYTLSGPADNVRNITVEFLSQGEN